MSDFTNHASNLVAFHLAPQIEKIEGGYKKTYKIYPWKLRTKCREKLTVWERNLDKNFTFALKREIKNGKGPLN